MGKERVRTKKLGLTLRLGPERGDRLSVLVNRQDESVRFAVVLHEEEGVVVDVADCTRFGVSWGSRGDRHGGVGGRRWRQ